MGIVLQAPLLRDLLVDLKVQGELTIVLFHDDTCCLNMLCHWRCTVGVHRVVKPVRQIKFKNYQNLIWKSEKMLGMLLYSISDCLLVTFQVHMQLFLENLQKKWRSLCLLHSLSPDSSHGARVVGWTWSQTAVGTCEPISQWASFEPSQNGGEIRGVWDSVGLFGADFSKFPSVCFVRYVCGQSLCKALVLKAVPSCEVLIVSVFH